VADADGVAGGDTLELGDGGTDGYTEGTPLDGDGLADSEGELGGVAPPLAVAGCDALTDTDADGVVLATDGVGVAVTELAD
jgi:hypothetical protein